jgi:NAD(P)-dependent dehydrogenase (short-subunit alcohol dehydrogenase family)
MTVDLAEELGPEGITVSCVHPADLMPTPMVRRTGLPPRSTVEQGAEAVLRASRATERGGTGDGPTYYNGLQPADPHPDVLCPDKRARLREATEALLAGSSQAAGF